MVIQIIKKYRRSFLIILLVVALVTVAVLVAFNYGRGLFVSETKLKNDILIEYTPSNEIPLISQPCIPVPDPYVNAPSFKAGETLEADVSRTAKENMSITSVRTLIKIKFTQNLNPETKKMDCIERDGAYSRTANVDDSVPKVEGEAITLYINIPKETPNGLYKFKGTVSYQVETIKKVSNWETQVFKVDNNKQ